MLVDAIAFALILLGLYLALAARKIAQGIYDRYEARHAPPPPPMLDLNRLEDLRNILRFEQKAPAARD